MEIGAAQWVVPENDWLVLSEGGARVNMAVGAPALSPHFRRAPGSVGLVLEQSTGVRGLEITSHREQGKKGMCSGGREQTRRLTELSPSSERRRSRGSGI